MAQHDFVINNQGFPSFRSDLNDFLNAVRTTHSGTSLPSGAVAGTIWLDTTSATIPLLKYYDGTDNILLATINHSTNTVTFAGASADLVNDTTPQLGGDLDVQTNKLVSTSNLNVKVYPNGTGVFEVGGSTNSGRIQLNCEQNSHGIKLASPPHSAAQSYTLTFPSTAPTNGKIMQTDGSGNLSFVDPASASLGTPLAVIGNATAGSEIRLPEDTDNGSNYVAIKAPDTIASNLTLTLPSADGSSGQVLQTNGSGVLSFAGVSGGKVLQVVSAIDQTERSATSTSYVTASNTLSVTITPATTSSRILIITSGTGYQDGGQSGFTIFRGATNLATATKPDLTHHESARSNIAMNFLDSPNTTSATTYQVYFRNTSGGATTNLNPNNSQSSIQAIEIGA